MTGEPIQKTSRAAFGFVFATVLLDMLALGLVVPVLPTLIKSFLGGDTASAADIVGYFGFAWALMQFIFQPLLGTLSDRVGRRPVIILSNIGLGLDYILMALSPTLWFLFVGRLISGITAASYGTAGAYIADVTPPEKRAVRFGMLGAAFGLGFVVGPAVGGVLGNIDLRLPFWAAAAVSLLNGAYGFFVLPESLPRDRREPFSWRRANPVGSIRLVGSSSVLIRLTVAGILQRLAQGSLPNMFVLYAIYRYNWNAATVGWSLALVGILQMIVSGGLVRPMIGRFGERGTLFIGLVTGVIGFMLYGVAPNSAVFLVAFPFVALWGLANPAIQSMGTRRVGALEQGQWQGAQASFSGMADMFGPLLFTHVFAAAIVARGAFHIPGAPYMLAAACIAGAMFVCWSVSNPVVPATAE
jgi:DHA1 family tetracycline resistance protein-like MFS transporter